MLFRSRIRNVCLLRSRCQGSRPVTGPQQQPRSNGFIDSCQTCIGFERFWKVRINPTQNSRIRCFAAIDFDIAVVVVVAAACGGVVAAVGIVFGVYRLFLVVWFGPLSSIVSPFSNIKSIPCLVSMFVGNRYYPEWFITTSCLMPSVGCKKWLRQRMESTQ